MSFNPTAQWLICVCQDGSVFLLPIYFIVTKKSSELMATKPIEQLVKPSMRNRKSTATAKDAPVNNIFGIRFAKSNQLNQIRSSVFGTLHDISVVIEPKLKGNVVPTDILWWKTWDGNDIGLCFSYHSYYFSFS